MCNVRYKEKSILTYISARYDKLLKDRSYRKYKLNHHKGIPLLYDFDKYKF